ncbi:MarR family transcriptional regulator [Vibrio sp. SCSIO 43136]|uniref:MarR family winged helix-turn-helix transcriptional regulator n=1 Tax=Vibrio sp. SCSIO 43136 TaxID=2819101 RepID=UPI002074E529|nr:MarR family transcriptional regulator [Vibrio sp. SCSIO 43136]
MADNENLKPYQTTAGVSWIATRQMQNRIQLEIQKRHKEINVEQLLVLMELDYEDGLRPSVLAERLQRSKGTMTSLIRHAEKNEYIASTPDPTHKNAKKIFLTLKGKKIHDELSQILNQELENAVSHISKEHQAIIKEAMVGMVMHYNPTFYDY